MSVSEGNGMLANWPVVGHDWAVELLQHMLVAGRLPHALLFAGPAQVGKTTLALTLASVLHCENTPKPCGTCRACRRIAHGNHPDVRLIQAEAGRGARDGILKIDQIRDLQREAALAPMEGRYKIFVLRELERANLPAANALLKTLEEPPSQVIMLLTSARPHALLPTIISRCQVIQLRPLSLSQVAEALRKRWDANDAQADLLARLSGGQVGWAVQRLTDEGAWQERTKRLKDIQILPRQGVVERLAYAEVLGRSPETVLPTLDLWVDWWRDLLLLQQGCGDFIRNVDLLAELQVQAGCFAPDQVRHYLARLQTAPTLLRQNVNARLLLEALVLRMPRAHVAV